jgi:hypothetical protein
MIPERQTCWDRVPVTVAVTHLEGDAERHTTWRRTPRRLALGVSQPRRRLLHRRSVAQGRRETWGPYDYPMMRDAGLQWSRSHWRKGLMHNAVMVESRLCALHPRRPAHL